MDDFGDRLQVLHKIGQGSFGRIYVVEDKRSRKKLAMKVEELDVRVPQLLFEAQMYNVMSSSVNVPRIYQSGFDGRANTMVIDLCGKSLESLLNLCHRRMSLKTVLMLADQMISAVQYFHSKNYIHRDIKPDNFVMGLGRKSNQVFVIDYGLAKRFRDQQTGIHYPYRDGLSLSGTARYASINALRGVDQSRRDDMEALAYVLIYLLKGSLPWMGIDCADRLQKHERIAHKKKHTPISELCKDLPSEFGEFLEMSRNLAFDEEPKYALARQMFRRLFRAQGYILDYKYDWSDLPAASLFPKPISASSRDRLATDKNSYSYSLTYSRGKHAHRAHHHTKRSEGYRKHEINEEKVPSPEHKKSHSKKDHKISPKNSKSSKKKSDERKPSPQRDPRESLRRELERRRREEHKRYLEEQRAAEELERKLEEDRRRARADAIRRRELEEAEERAQQREREERIRRRRPTPEEIKEIESRELRNRVRQDERRRREGMQRQFRLEPQRTSKKSSSKRRKQSTSSYSYTYSYSYDPKPRRSSHKAKKSSGRHYH